MWCPTNTWTGCFCIPTSKGFLRCKTDQTTEKMMFSLLVYDPAISSPTWSFTRSHLSDCCQEQDLLHWLCECLALITMRQRVFGYRQGSLEWLPTWPGDVVAYARMTWSTLTPKPITSKWLAPKHTCIHTQTLTPIDMLVAF